MSYKFPKFLGRKKKDKEKLKEQDALSRQHLMTNDFQPIVKDLRESSGTLEEYLRAKHEARGQSSGGFKHTDNQGISSDRFVSNYRSVHADRFQGRTRNFDEDDEIGHGNFEELQKDMMAHWEEEGDPFDMPTRAQRSQAFNEEIDIGEFKIKGELMGFEVVDDGNVKKETLSDFNPLMDSGGAGQEMSLKDDGAERVNEKDDDDDEKIPTVISEDFELADEEEKLDEVAPLIGTSPQRQTETRASRSSGRHASASVLNILDAKLSLDERTAAMVIKGSNSPKNTKSSNMVSPEKGRAMSIVEQDRQERLRKKIQVGEEMDSDQLAGRASATKPDEQGKAVAPLTDSMNENAELTTEERAELKQYQQELEREENMDEGSVGENKKNKEFLSDNSDEAYDFLADFYKEMNNVELDSHVQDVSAAVSGKKATALAFDLSSSSSDLIKFVDFNERRHQLEAAKFLRQNSFLETFSQEKQEFKQHVLSAEIPLQRINAQMLSQYNYSYAKPTVVTLTEDLILVGTTSGEVWMYDPSSQALFCQFIEKGREFSNGNPVTAIAAHPAKSDYILVGYKGGQVILLDVTEQTPDHSKSIKVIKDHHKGCPISNLQFCDSIQGNQFTQVQRAQQPHLHSPQDLNPYEQDADLQKQYEAMSEWMFISMDVEGKVVIGHVYRQYMFTRVKKYVLIEPRLGKSSFQSLACRFRSPLHPAEHKINDLVTLVAVGNTQSVMILAITHESSQLLKEIPRPKYVSLQSDGTPRDLEDVYPALEWGYGFSPALKNKCYPTLAVGWGPLLQLYCLNNLIEQSGQIFFEDGFTVIQSENNDSMMRLSRTGSITVNPFLGGSQIEINPYEQPSRFEAIRESENLRSSQIEPGAISPFEMKDQFIERIWYLSDSLLLVLTKSLEFKVVYTQRLDYGKYEATKFNHLSKKQKQNKQNFLVDDGVVLTSLVPSLTDNFLQSVAVNKGLIVPLGISGLTKFQHMSWEESLEAFKQISKGNWIQDFSRAIEIYTGQIKGFKNVPEEQELRQEQMKGELKLFIRTIIMDQLDKWNMEKEQDSGSIDNPYASSGGVVEQQEGNTLDDSNIELLHHLDSQKNDTRRLRYNNLIRIAIEFCVIVKDCYFLFYDLFLLFQEEQLEEIFLDELKPFIMAGLFQSWEIPSDILQNHIINYYKDPDFPEQIEKIIINLNLSDCPDEVIVSLIQFSEQNFLSTALIALHTAAYQDKDSATCIHVILSLLDLYKQAKETNPGSYEALQEINQHPPDAIERLKAEKSQFYLGYKILWVIRLILSGKKFPQGHIDEVQWRKHVHELVDCITSKNVMLDLLCIDAEAYFQIISILFYRGKVFDFIQDDRLQQERVVKVLKEQVQNSIIPDEMYMDMHMTYLSHNDILQRFEDVLMSNKMEVPNEIRMQYLFFVANVASKQVVKKENKFYFNCMKELLTQSTKFLKFNKMVMQRAFKKKHKDDGHHFRDENRHLYVTEKALVELMELCEPLEAKDVDDLLEMTKQTRFNQLRVMLLEKKDDLVQCLQLLIEGMKLNSYAAQRKEAVNKVFDWINIKLDLFAAKKIDMNKESTLKEDALRQQILAEFSELVNLDAKATFILIDEKFNHDHEKFVQSLIQQGSTEQQFKYLETMLSTHHQQIQNCIEDYLTQGNQREKALTYMNLQNMHLHLLCQHYPDRVLERVRQIKKNEVHANIDDCLEICQKFDQTEASAIFLYKLGSYLSASQKYLSLMTDKSVFNYPLLTKQLASITEIGLRIPHFVPFPSGEEKRRSKQILRAMYQKSFQWTPSCEFSLDHWNTRLLVRFDYLLRKAVNASAKESTENFNEATIQTTWFTTLDSIFKVKYSQLRILRKLKEQAVFQKNPVGGLAQARALVMKYEAHARNVEEFYRSRIAFVVERTLKHIGPEEFLDHVAASDGEIMFKELRDMILLIFSETSNEHAVLVHACRSANQHGIETFASLGREVCMGLKFDYRRCLICKRFVDELQNQNKRFAVGGRSRTLSGQLAVNSESEDDVEQPFIDPFCDQLTLYDCGHCFHTKCVERRIRENVGDSQRRAAKGRPIRNQQVTVTKKMMESEPCPHCHSDQFKIDFENIFARRVVSTKGASTSRGSEQANTTADDGQPTSDDESMQFSQSKTYRKHERREMRATSIIKYARTIQEQKMHHFDSAFNNQGVTVNNFRRAI